ncbi:hypothetical protein LAZ67_3005540 [Cordylochernes scorpioides]|uniref:C2H2-type domain-containing protein n=1 Tax=Cordylochernes scorpioides TaxID=51811 RepID=A0ABY6KAE5_9ARAC|nr:hypothetical protein LAZ67_3005540 [Cordylochernes scorpioides]
MYGLIERHVNISSKNLIKYSCEDYIQYISSSYIFENLNVSVKACLQYQNDHKGTWKSNANLQILRQATHTGEREFMCDWKGCNFRSNRKFNVAQHKVTHTEEKPFTCDHCPYRSAHKTNFKVHMRKHTNSKPYICDLCGFQTSYSGSLNGHKRNKHTDPALNASCARTTPARRASVVGSVGTGPSPGPTSSVTRRSTTLLLYSCSLCGTRSKSKTYFTKHMKNKHQVLNINIE